MNDLAQLFYELQALYWLHFTSHWRSRGDVSYQDHLLFQRLYENIDGSGEGESEIDSIAEKLMGAGMESVVEPVRMLSGVLEYAKAVSAPPEALIMAALDAEERFIRHIEEIMERGMSAGVEDLLGGIASTHETHVYLLKQRLQPVSLEAEWGPTLADEE